MPLYDFACQSCGERFEARALPDDSVSCPSCHSDRTQRLLSAFAGPFTVAPRGAAAKRSNAERSAREEQRRERREQRRSGQPE